jgi:hypothetical protein
MHNMQYAEYAEYINQCAQYAEYTNNMQENIQNSVSKTTFQICNYLLFYSEHGNKYVK